MADLPRGSAPLARRLRTAHLQEERDRSKAFELKAELDRNGVFDEFEDRFLDLLRKAE